MGTFSGNHRDRRNDLRIEVSFPVLLITHGGERLPGVVENVSLGGALLRTDESLALDMGIELTIEPGEPSTFKLPARILRASGPHAYGSAFAPLSEDDADRLLDVAARCLRAAAPLPWFLG